MAFQGVVLSNEMIKRSEAESEDVSGNFGARSPYLKANRHKHGMCYLNPLLSMSCLFKRKPAADDVFGRPPRISNLSSPNLDLSSSYLVAHSCDLRKTRP